MVPDFPWAPCIPQFIMIIYTLIRRPYNYFVDNLRSCFNFMVMMAITSMKVFIFNVDLSTYLNWYYYPVIILGLLFFVVLWGLLISIIDIIRANCGKKK